MTLTAFRLTQSKFVDAAFDGEGARLYGGRWNSPGTRMVYVASSLSLATLELLVHLEDIALLDRLYQVIVIEFDERLVQVLDDSLLSPAWNSPAPTSETQIIGDRWIASGTSAILSVPSAVTVNERNYPLNPAHADFRFIQIQPPVPFRIDPRLKRMG
ncbi:RES family NAD+ phosphorylase [Planctomicrobium piriforme]|uniref:RES domain-containing protein n=1 Tax=Planctomicrobium piriforme TaxID=1576369 RepID=A0A1I3AT42_9PLAN|nr:RES family NAD+ phosphorylase [Planctomicrobium piriforme]SFH52976.1 RES domain-containing protein [Planctomicrobium piriforme]